MILRPGIQGHAKRGTGLINNELYIGRLMWNRLRYVKNPEASKRVSRINCERCASGARDRKELAGVEKKIAVIEDDGYIRGVVDRLRELEARQDELNERLSTVPVDILDIHPNVADIYRRKVVRLAEALDHPEDRDAAASAIRGLIERIVPTPSEKWAEMDAVRHGDLGAILAWTGNGRENMKTDIPMPEMSVSVVAGAGNRVSALFRTEILCGGGAIPDETARLYRVLDQRLQGRERLCSAYSVSDIAPWPWLRRYNGSGNPEVEDREYLRAWMARVAARPACPRGGKRPPSPKRILVVDMAKKKLVR